MGPALEWWVFLCALRCGRAKQPETTQHNTVGGRPSTRAAFEGPVASRPRPKAHGRSKGLSIDQAQPVWTHRSTSMSNVLLSVVSGFKNENTMGRPSILSPCAWVGLDTHMNGPTLSSA